MDVGEGERPDIHMYVTCQGVLYDMYAMVDDLRG